MGNCCGLLGVDYGEDSPYPKRYGLIHISNYQNIEDDYEIECLVSEVASDYLFNSKEDADSWANQQMRDYDSFYYASKMGVWWWDAERGQYI